MNTKPENLHAKLRELFSLPLHVSQRATDTPDNPGRELHAIIADANGRARLSVAVGATAALDNARAECVAAAINAYAHGEPAKPRIVITIDEADGWLNVYTECDADVRIITTGVMDTAKAQIIPYDRDDDEDSETLGIVSDHDAGTDPEFVARVFSMDATK